MAQNNIVYFDANGCTSNAERFVKNLQVTNITSVMAINDKIKVTKKGKIKITKNGCFF